MEGDGSLYGECYDGRSLQRSFFVLPGNDLEDFMEFPDILNRASMFVPSIVLRSRFSLFSYNNLMTYPYPIIFAV